MRKSVSPCYGIPILWSLISGTMSLVVAGTLLTTLCVAQQRTPAGTSPDSGPFEPVQDQEGLPRVLLLGDSISIGYTQPVRELLAGKANVHRALENCGPTTRGLEKLDQWLGHQPWDVIHFNFGLHDLKYVDADGNRTEPPEGSRQVPPEEYEQNLRKIVARLRETGATLIWCTTTPVPDGAAGRVAGDAKAYNAIAARVMRMTQGEERIINDLFGLAKPQLGRIQRPRNVHFTRHGSQVLARQVADIIQKHLPQPEPADRLTATGIVFHDIDGNGVRNDADPPLADVRVSNGREIVRTDADGRYRLPVDDDTILFVIKPRGWRTPLSDNMLPRFYYIHKPAGSPQQQYSGVPPTGPLPASIDFPLYRQEEPSQFKAILFGDPQPRNQKEVDYIAHDVVEELVGTDASFGVTLGDIVFDNLDVFDAQARAIAVLGIPWYNVIGNHDINYDARRDRHSDETFERNFGPAYYSFDYGPVHFLVLDDVEWLINEVGEGQYQGGLGKQQLQFIRRDLALLPDDQLVVLMMHIPLVQVRDRQDLYRLIEKRPFCLSISAHRHFHQHRFITREDGWRGPEPHHHVINVTVSGSWWSGMPDDRGIPHTLMADGAPNGYSIVTFDGNTYSFRFKAAGRPADYQMKIYAPEVVRSEETEETEVLANVFNGSDRSTVEMKVGDQGSWMPMRRVDVEDPLFRRIRETELAIRQGLAARGTDPDTVLRELTEPKISSHIWRGTLPRDLAAGSHLIRVRTRDMDGQRYAGRRIVRVARPEPATAGSGQ